MATFAPDIPTQEPQHVEFKPTTRFEGNQAGKYLYGGIGHALATGAQALDEAAKMNVKAQTRNMVEPATDDFIHGLESTWDQMKGQAGQQDAAESNRLPSDPIWNQQTMALPEGVKVGMQNIEKMQSARDYGKIPEMYYLSNLYEDLKRLRSVHPGYEDEIDAEAHRITGFPVAKTLMSTIMSNIEHGLGEKDKLKDHLISSAVSLNSQGFGAAGVIAAQVQSGQMSVQQGLAEISKITSFKAQKEINEATMSDINLKEKHYGYEVGQAASHLTNGYVSQFFNMPFSQGRDKNSNVTLGQWVTQMDGKDIDDTAVEAGRQHFVIAAQMLSDKIDADLRAPIPGRTDGKSMMDLDSRAALDAKERAMKQVQGYVELLSTKGGKGIAAMHAIMTDHIQNDNMYGLLTDPETSEIAQRIQSMRKVLGEQNPFLGDYTHQQLDKAGDKFGRFAVKKEIGFMFPAPGKPVGTFKQAMEETQKNFVDPSTNKPLELPHIYADYVKHVNWMLDARVPREQKLSLVEAYFSPKNRDSLKFFEKDYTDPSTGETIPGKYSVYAAWGSERMAHEVKKLGDANAWAMYQNWHEVEFSTLFHSELGNLNAIKNIAGAELVFADNKFHLTFDPKNVGRPLYAHEALTRNSRYPGEIGTPEYFAAKDQIENLNRGLDTFSNVAKLAKLPVDEWLMANLTRWGYDPNVKATAELIAKSRTMNVMEDNPQLSAKTPKKNQERVGPQ